MAEKTAAFRPRRAADSARWRERLHRRAAVYPVEVDGELFDLMERFGGVKFEVQ
jgi:glutathione synthase/RimK-type ligase-like ATP-grasp enzyme